MRCVLILTRTGVSFTRGTNAAQKGIRLIMLAIIGLMPAGHALDVDTTHEQKIEQAAARMRSASEFIECVGEVGCRPRKGIAGAAN